MDLDDFFIQFFFWHLFYLPPNTRGTSEDPSRHTSVPRHTGYKSHTYRLLLGKPESKRPPGRYKGIWEDNIKLDLRGIDWDGMGLIDLAEDRDSWRALVLVTK
jgi:hypothetical protein